MSDQWEQCPAGELQQMVGALKSRRRSATNRGWGTLAAVAVVVVLFGYAVSTQVTNWQRPGGLACTEMQNLRADYTANTLDADVRQQVESHLAHCQSCRALYAGQASAPRPDDQVVARHDGHNRAGGF